MGAVSACRAVTLQVKIGHVHRRIIREARGSCPGRGLARNARRRDARAGFVQTRPRRTGELRRPQVRPERRLGTAVRLRPRVPDLLLAGRRGGRDTVVSRRQVESEAGRQRGGRQPRRIPESELIKNPPPATVTHDEVVARLLAKRPGLAAEYLQAAAEDAADPAGRVAFLRALRRVAKSKGLKPIAAAAGLSVPSLSRSLSDRGNPTLKTLGSVVAASGGRITVTFPASVPSGRTGRSAARAPSRTRDNAAPAS